MILYVTEINEILLLNLSFKSKIFNEKILDSLIRFKSEKIGDFFGK